MEWDPLGFVEMGAPRDEYDCLLGPLMRHLQQRSPDGVISSFLEHRFAHHFGCAGHPSDEERQQFIDRARAWFSEHGRDMHT